MSGIFDYIEWRGDLRITEVPVNDVDILILCRLSYAPFKGVVPSTAEEGSVVLGQAAQTVLDYANRGLKKFRKKEDQRLLQVMTESPRFTEINLCCHTDVLNEALEEQFSATSMELDDGTVAVIYRGTDGTLVGWKEDFNMSFSSATPAQRDAIAYLNLVAKRFPDKPLRVAGHSKGGNLALYASIYCEPEIQERIISVRNYDGPGFNEYQIHAENFSRVSDVTLTYLPDSSVIGMLLEHMGRSVIVASQSMGLFQHNIYLWEIRRSGFITKEELTDSSRMIDRTLKEWLNSLTVEQREQMIDGFFSILGSSDGKTLRELWYGQNVITILSTAAKLDPETKSNIDICMKLLRKALKNNTGTGRVVSKMLESNLKNTHR